MTTTEVADSPVAIMGRMAEIEVALSSMEGEWGGAEDSMVRLKGQMEKREAQLWLAHRGTGTIPEVDARVHDALWSETTADGGSLMDQLVIAEATVAGCKARFKTLDRELSSLQSRLAAQVRLDTVPGGMQHDRT